MSRFDTAVPCQVRESKIDDQDAFDAAVRPHWQAMRVLAERFVGANVRDDVLQDALTEAWKARQRFNPSLGSERAWLLGITANCARRSLRRSRVLDKLPLNRAQGTGPPTERLDLERAVRGLPDRQRLAVELYYFVDLSLRDVAQVLECAEGTVKSTLASARATLRTKLGEHYRE